MTSDYFNLEKQRLTLRKILNSAVEDVGSFKVEVHGALLDQKGFLIDAVGPNPLHFGSFESVVKAAKAYVTLKINETLITNDPYSGNTRLCDLVLVQGVYGRQQANELRYYIALQISLPQLINKNQNALFSSVEEEGFRIPPTLLEQGAAFN